MSDTPNKPVTRGVVTLEIDVEFLRDLQWSDLDRFEEQIVRGHQMVAEVDPQTYQPTIIAVSARRIKWKVKD